MLEDTGDADKLDDNSSEPANDSLLIKVNNWDRIDLHPCNDKAIPSLFSKRWERWLTTCSRSLLMKISKN